MLEVIAVDNIFVCILPVCSCRFSNILRLFIEKIAVDNIFEESDDISEIWLEYSDIYFQLRVKIVFFLNYYSFSISPAREPT